MSELTSVLNGLGAAAKNPFAFVGYIIAVVSWAYLRARVERNKNLLQNLGKFPEAERGKKLSEEMGTAPLEGGLTPEQWIESRSKQDMPSPSRQLSACPPARPRRKCVHR